MIAVVDYDMGNVASVVNMLRRIGAKDAVLTHEPDVIQNAGKVIVPGVGAFDNGMKNLADAGLLDVLNEAALQRRIPVLGICLGMQLLTEASEEGMRPGLGWVKGKTVRFEFPQGSPLKVPHIGWNYVSATRSSPLFRADERSRFYFVHAYHVVCKDSDATIASAHYGFDFTCALNKANIYGVQFHPEKSHRFGMRLLKRFIAL